MADDAQPRRTLIQKIDALSPEQAAQVEAFVDGLTGDRALQRAMLTLSAPAFAAVSDNPEDAIYDDF